METANRQTNRFIRAALILFIILLAIYIARSDSGSGASGATLKFSIFVTNELNGYREPCG